MTSATLLLTLTSLLQLPGLGPGGDAQWRELRPKDGGFHVQMPGDAATQKPLVNPGGVTKLTGLFGIYRNGIGYFAGFADVPAAKLAKGADAWLDDCKSGFVKLNKAKVVDERAIKVDDHPGREMTIEFTLKSSGVRQTSKVRMYLVKERYYFLQALASKRHGLPGGTDEFLDSFALNDSPNAKVPPGGLPGSGGVAQGGFPARAGRAAPGAPNAIPQGTTRGSVARPGAEADGQAEPPTTAGGPDATPPLALRGMKGRLPAASAAQAKPRPSETEDKATSWAKYSSREGRFEVLMPGEPKEDKQKVKKPDGEIEVRLVFAQAAPTEVFAVLYMDMPSRARAKELVEAPLDPSQAIVGVPGGANLKVVDEKQKVIDGHPTRTLLMEPSEAGPGETGNAVESRIVVVEKRVYMLYSVRPQGKERTKEVDRFFDSFKVTTKG
jgi:hypothetical protein